MPELLHSFARDAPVVQKQEKKKAMHINERGLLDIPRIELDTDWTDSFERLYILNLMHFKSDQRWVAQRNILDINRFSIWNLI